jgi:hypothetical protein
LPHSLIADRSTDPAVYSNSAFSIAIQTAAPTKAMIRIKFYNEADKQKDW